MWYILCLMYRGSNASGVLSVVPGAVYNMFVALCGVSEVSDGVSDVKSDVYWYVYVMCLLVCFW